MKNLRILLVACILGAGLAACGDSSAPLAPENPSFDNGPFTIGSGSRTSDPNTTTTTTTSTETTTEDTTPQRGGPFTVGSGN